MDIPNYLIKEEEEEEGLTLPPVVLLLQLCAFDARKPQ